MPRGKSTDDATTLQMALVGYELQKQKIDEKIREVQADLRGRGAASSAASKNTGAPKRTLSLAARRRIAAAQRKRWAEHRRRMAAARGE